MKRVALDSNIAVELLNKNESTIDKLSKFDVFYLPVIVCGELLYGASNSKNKTKNLKVFNRFIESCKILNTNNLVAHQYSQIRLELKKKGKPIPENDIWIAAICKVNNIPLVSRDKHFKYIDELKLINRI